MQRVLQVGRRWNYLTNEERLREIILFSLEQRMLGAFLSMRINTRLRDYGRQTQILVLTRVNGHKLKYRKFCLKIRNKNHHFFIVRMVEHENKFSVESLERLKTEVDMP